MPNMKSIITSHNKCILKKEQHPQNLKTCNCLDKKNCPINNKCLSSNVIYEATLKTNDPKYTEKKYIGSCETTFKKRYRNHKQSFTTEKYKYSTTLSTEFLETKGIKSTTNGILENTPKNNLLHPRNQQMSSMHARKILHCNIK